MSVEKKKLDVSRLEIDKIRREATIVGLGRARFAVNGSQLKCLELLKEGMTIFEIITHHHLKGLQFSYESLLSVLEFLNQQNIIADADLQAYFAEENDEPKSLLESVAEKIFGSAPEKIKVKDEVRNLPFFRSLPPTLVESLLREGKVIEAPANIVISKVGQIQRSLFVLIRGQASVYHRELNGKKNKVVTLNAGSVFGEVGFFLGEARTAEVITDTSSVILRINYVPELFGELSKDGAIREVQQRCWVIHALLKSEFFSCIPRECFDALLFAGKVKTFLPRTRLCNEGDAGDACFLIVQGKALVTKRSAEIAKLGQGDCFGEIALMMSHGLRTATVKSDTEVMALEIGKLQFQELLAGNLRLGCVFEGIMTSRDQADRNRKPA